MDTCGNGQPDPDPYQLLGVARQAGQSEIAQAEAATRYLDDVRGWSW